MKAAYGEKYDPMMMHDRKWDVANLLHEEAEARSIRERLRRSKKTQQTQQQRKTRRHEQERYIFAGVHFERCTPAFLLYPRKLWKITAIGAIIILDIYMRILHLHIFDLSF